MNNPTHVDDLLSQWQQRAAQGQPISAEELCQDCPELLEGLRRRLDVLRQMEHLAQEVHASTVPTAPGPSACSATASYSGDPSLPSALPSPLFSGTPPLPDLPGYEVLGRLGKGGMGIVYEARDRQLGRAVAIKMIQDAGLDEEQRRRFLTEAKVAAALNHPHIVQLFALGEHHGQPYLVMELVRGPTLQQRLRGHVQPARDAAQLVLLLAQALHAAHERRIIHRDLKPGNVLLAPLAADPALNSVWGCPKVVDFGLARWLDADEHLTRTGDVAGTPSYMAPEQALGRLHDIGPATDVYALGAILYELLTDRPPFRGLTFAAILQQLLHYDPIPLRRLQPETPRDLETVCLKCLEKEPARRYLSARALAEDLARFLKGEPIQARPVGRVEQVWKWARRQPLVASLLAILTVVLVLAFLGLAYGWRKAEWARTLESGRAEYERQARQDTEKELYRNRILLADRDLAIARPNWAEATLQQCPPALRQWEWFHLNYRCGHAELPPLAGHGGGVSCVAVTVNGQRLASAAGGVVRLWEPGASRPAHLLRGHLGGVNWIAFTPAGDELLSGGEDARILLWDPTSGAQRGRFDEHEGPISCFAVHPVRPWVASATFGGNQAGEVLLWDRHTRTVLHRLQGHTSSISGLAISPDGELLASASHDRTVVLWNPHTGERLRTFREHRLPVSCVAFSPDGQTLASAAGRIQSERPEEDEILIWEADSGNVRHRLRGHSERAVTLAFAPRGLRLATAGWDRQIKVWDTQTGQEVLTLTGHQKAVMSLTFTADGELMSGSLDETVRIWQAPAAGTAGAWAAERKKGP